MSWRLVETCCHSGFDERPSAYDGVKNSQGIIITIIIIIIIIISGGPQNKIERMWKAE